jgi:serine protease inhibitor
VDLGRALLERLDGDVVLSPYGLGRALDVIRRGATGATREALDSVLGSEPPPEVAADGLALAQAAWLAAGYSAGPALDGLDHGPLEVGAVNAWARERTHGMIPRIVERFDSDEILALTDAAYLHAKWAHPFSAAGTRPFAGAGDVAMMTVRGSFEHAGEQAVRLPYGDGTLRFTARLGEALDPGEESWRSDDGRVELPRFTATSALELAPMLRRLGLGPAFDGGHDLDELVVGPGEKALSRVDQRARVEVDEQGTRAAAVTTVGMMRASARIADPFHIVFDRPFTWAVEHAATGTVLFLGRVLNPTERSD